ncbi:MAG: LysR family transcriptional regulator [Eubacteriales bacterium]|jgi:DNA-binding transcriptional LysR family regulator|nr:LysR family transcriptional regulator [Eubacteriales bacterium]
MNGRPDLYRVFLTAAESDSISAAAKRLFVSQPAVSGSIMSLEEALGTKLFKRESRGIRLTPEGEVLYEYVKKAFIYLEAGEDKLRDIHTLAGGVLRVGASDMTLRFYLLDYIERFNLLYPAVRLSVTNAPTPRTIRELRADEIDFGVISGPVNQAEAAGMELVPVRKIRDIVIASDKYAVGADGRPVRAEELADYPLIMLEKGTSTRTYLDSLLPPSMRAPAIELATSDLVLDFARRGIGIACIVEDFAREDIAGGLLREIRLDKPFPPRDFYLIYKKNYPHSSASKRFIGMLTDDGGK